MGWGEGVQLWGTRLKCILSPYRDWRFPLRVTPFSQNHGNDPLHSSPLESPQFASIREHVICRHLLHLDDAIILVGVYTYTVCRTISKVGIPLAAPSHSSHRLPSNAEPTYDYRFQHRLETRTHESNRPREVHVRSDCRTLSTPVGLPSLRYLHESTSSIG